MWDHMDMIGSHRKVQADTRATRFNIETELTLWLVENRSVIRTGRVKNISGTGFCACVDFPAPAGSIVEFELRMPVGSTTMEGCGKLVWQHRSSETNLLGIEIRYYALNHEAPDQYSAHNSKEFIQPALI